MKISQLKSLIKESIKEVLKENEINTIDYQKLKKIYTLASKLKLYEPYIVDETIEDIKALENAVKTNDESIFETMEESQVDTYELSGLANLNPEQQARWRGIDIALRELSRIIYKMDFNLIGEKFKKLAVAINNFKDPVMQERRKMPLKENSLNEDMSLVGDVALGVAGGLAGLWALVKGVPFVAKTFGNVAGQLASAMEDNARSARRKAAQDGYAEVITTIATKFGNDSTLQSMYQSLPKEPGAERTAQLKTIAKYIKSKLTPEEMKYFSDVSSMLRTGSLTSSGKSRSIY
jgi:hypothetical protein